MIVGASIVKVSVSGRMHCVVCPGYNFHSVNVSDTRSNDQIRLA